MPKYKRKKGKNEGTRAVFHVYDGNFCKLECEVPANLADDLLQSSFGSSGVCHATLLFDGKSVPVRIAGGRIDSFDRASVMVGTGVVSFSSLIEDK